MGTHTYTHAHTLLSCCQKWKVKKLFYTVSLTFSLHLPLRCLFNWLSRFVFLIHECTPEETVCQKADKERRKSYTGLIKTVSDKGQCSSLHSKLCTCERACECPCCECRRSSMSDSRRGYPWREPSSVCVATWQQQPARQAFGGEQQPLLVHV